MAIGLSGLSAGLTEDEATGQAAPARRDHLRAAPVVAEVPQQPYTEATAAPADPSPEPPHCDSRLLKKSLAQLEAQSEKVMASFFTTLFMRNPELRPLFPSALDSQRKRVFDAVARCVWASDRPESPAGWLRELARDHRKFGVTESHYRPFCDALLVTLRNFGGGTWPGPTMAAWEHALQHAAKVMADSVRDSAATPPWWVADVIEHDKRRPDLTVLTLRLDQDLPYRPGQHVSIQVPRWPRVWREYSIANPPSPDRQLRLHVRAVPGGMVSNVLVHETRVGDSLIVGRARGTMTADAAFSHTVVCIAGGTGLAPVKAIVETLASPDKPPPRPDVCVFVGARTQADLYDLPDLRRLEITYPSVTMVPVISHDPAFRGPRGMLSDVAGAHLPPGTGDVFVSGPPVMVSRTAAIVAARAPGVRIHLDPLPS
jgi:NAD(P)H-flavin reductase/hemoglobin-like flavoprotein